MMKMKGRKRQTYKDKTLEYELQTGLDFVEVLVVRQEVFGEMMIGIVDHHLCKLVETIVQAKGIRTHCATANTGRFVRPVGHVAVRIVLVAACRVVFSLHNIVQTSVVETADNLE